MTRSRIASKSDELVRRHKEVESVELTDEEIRYAIHQAKIAKWNRERNAEYWQEQERKRIKTKQI